MKNLIVTIGANGSGKTSFLDILSVQAASASRNLHNILQRQGGLNESLTRGKARELEIKLAMKVPDENLLQYSLTLAPQWLLYEIRDENLAAAQSQ